MTVQNNNRLRRRTVMALPASFPHSVVVTADTKYKSSTFPWAGGGGGGGGAVVKNDKCIKSK